MIQHLVEPPLAAMTWSNCFLYDCYQSLTFLWRNIVPFYRLVASVYWHLQIIVYAQLSSSPTTALKCGGLVYYHCNTFSLFFFTHSLLDLPLCLGSLCCCVTQFQPSFGCRTDGLTFDCRVFWYTEEFKIGSQCPCPEPAKHVQIITNPALCLTDGMRRLCWHVVFGFHQLWCCALWPNTSILVSSVEKDIVPSSFLLLSNKSYLFDLVLIETVIYFHI